MERWKTVIAVGFLIVAVGFFIRMVSGTDSAWADADNTPANAIPVRCAGITAVGSRDQYDCVRQDDRSSFTEVPEGHYLLVTDIVVTRNALTTTGDYFIWIGRYTGDVIPASPVMSLSGSTPLETNTYHFQSPYIILTAGESLGISNNDSDFGVNTYVSGFLVTDVTYQVLFRSYLPVSMSQ